MRFMMLMIPKGHEKAAPGTMAAQGVVTPQAQRFAMALTGANA